MRRASVVLAATLAPALAVAQRPPLQEQPPLQQQMQSLPSYAAPGAPRAYPPQGARPGAYPPSYQPGESGQTGYAQPGYQPGMAPAPPGTAQAPPDQAPSSEAAPQAPEAPAQPPNNWQPAPAAKLQALDKVTAQAQALTVKVGQSAQFGSLTITVKSCVVRPPNEPQDAAAYVDVKDSHPDQEGFDGWLLANEPSVSMMQNPSYDLRVTGCA